MVDQRPEAAAGPPRPYILIAVANPARARDLRAAALELADDVVVASDGAEAKQLIARRGAPRLLITDLSLPMIEGFALIRHLRQTAPRSRAAVVVLSAHEALRTAARDLADSLGISKVLRVDTDRPALRAAIASAYNEVEERTPPPTRPDDRAGAATQPPAYEDVLHEAVVAAARRFHAAGAAAYVRVGGETRFVGYAAAGPDQLFTGASAWTSLAQVASNGELLVVPDVEGHPVFGTPGGVGEAIRGFATVPLAAPSGGWIGALCVFDTKPLALDAAALEALAAQGQDIGRTLGERLVPDPVKDIFRHLEELAATDPLTGLVNRRGCEKSIASEISRARREQKPLSCIMIDIDRFKQVNDTYGHPTGDKLLRELSDIMRRSVRAYDIVCRWGGEEFLIVLPGADLPAARALAERIRLAVEALATRTVRGVTISAGIAAFDETYDLEATIRTADRRLYQAKAAGRNCVI